MSYERELIDAGVIDARDKLPRNPNGVKFGHRDPSRIEGVVFHQGLSWGSIEALAKYHTGPNHISDKGLESLSYTMAIDRRGEIYLANDVDIKTWSQGTKKLPGDENAKYIAVVLEGAFRWRNSGDEYLGMQLGEPTPAQIKSIFRTITILAHLFRFGIDRVYGHFDFGKPSCPGLTVETLIRSLRSQYEFDIETERKRFLKDYGFSSVNQFQAWARENYKDNVVVDGVWGPQTEGAAKWFLTQITS